MNSKHIHPPAHHLSATYRFATFGAAEEWAKQVRSEITGDSIIVEVRHHEVTLVYPNRKGSNEPLNGAPVEPLRV